MFDVGVCARMKVSVNTKRASAPRCNVCEHICEHRNVFDRLKLLFQDVWNNNLCLI